MSLGLTLKRPEVEFYDLHDGGDIVPVFRMWPLDRLSERLAACAEQAEVGAIECELLLSLTNAVRRNKIPSGPAPFWRDALRMCAARRQQLCADRRQASGGASADHWTWS